MNSSFFIDRPIFSAVISIVIVLVGLISMTGLPVEQYPDITSPQVLISTSYPGANAETVAQAVATPLEQQLNGTPNMIYMSTICNNNGGVTITVTFDIGTNAALAAVEVQNRVKLAEARLPADVIQSGINIEQVAPSRLLTVGIVPTDPKYDEVYLSNFATINVLDKLRRVNGVGRVSNIGSRYYGMRVWALPDRLASFKLTTSDIIDAIKDSNRESAGGEIGVQPNTNLDVTYPISAQGRLSEEEQFQQIIVKAKTDGTVIRLKDVARVELASSSYSINSLLDGKNAALLQVYLLPGANAVKVADEIKALMEEISQDFPEGIEYTIPFDISNYIKDSIKEVYITLIEALLLVIVIVFLSLQSWRSSLIPTIAIPISLIGTFAFMQLFGFTINTVSLLGLVLAIGIVVDDAIVVVENVERLMEEEGIDARQAAHKSMKQLSSALVSTSLVLAAVFVPVSFLGGITGSLFRQFSITIIVAVLISTLIALTLSPALAALLMRPKKGTKNIVFRKIDEWLDKVRNRSLGVTQKLFKRPRRAFTGYAAILLLGIVFMRILPTGFIPTEDQGFFFVEVELPDGASMERTEKITKRVEAYFLDHPAVDHVQTSIGSSRMVGTTESRSQLMIMLKTFDERAGNQTTIPEIKEAFLDVAKEMPEARVHVMMPPVVPGLGNSGGFELQLENRKSSSKEKMIATVDTLLKYAAEDDALSGTSSNLKARIPTIYYNLDRDRAKFLGIPLKDIFTNMKAFIGSVYVNDFNMLNRVYRVYIQADAPYRSSPKDLDRYYVRANTGAMVPMSALGQGELSAGPGAVYHFNMFENVTITGNPSPGYSSGQAMDAIEKICNEKLPEGFGYDWSGMSYQEKQAGGQTGIILMIAALFAFLFLAAQFESWIIPIIILMSLPISVMGASMGTFFRGLESDVYFQIGLVALLGLAAKNAILIVEFAKELVDRENYTPTEAALEALKLRFRPLVMTSISFVLGMLPLVIASGAGSGSRHSIGTGVFIGMIIAIVLGVLYIPFFYAQVMEWSMKRKGKKG